MHTVSQIAGRLLISLSYRFQTAPSARRCPFPAPFLYDAAMTDHNRSGDIGKVRKFEHPGRSRARVRPVPKGRQVDPRAADAIRALLGEAPRDRDLLIEYLHRIQDTYGQISAAHLAALAEEMRLSFAEVFETATFYAHFDVVKEDGKDIPTLTVRVCDSLTCAMLGGEQLLHELQNQAGPGVRVVRAPCVGFCAQAPVAEVGHRYVLNATVPEVLATASRGETDPIMPDYVG